MTSTKPQVPRHHLFAYMVLFFHFMKNWRPSCLEFNKKSWLASQTVVEFLTLNIHCPRNIYCIALISFLSNSPWPPPPAPPDDQLCQFQRPREFSILQEQGLNSKLWSSSQAWNWTGEGGHLRVNSKTFYWGFLKYTPLLDTGSRGDFVIFRRCERTLEM